MRMKILNFMYLNLRRVKSVPPHFIAMLRLHIEDICLWEKKSHGIKYIIEGQWEISNIGSTGRKGQQLELSLIYSLT
jgi:hypothetical protein